MLKVNHRELNELIKEYYKHKISLLIYGRFGIGKSFVVKDTSKEIAKQNKREFVNWNLLTEKEKEDIFENPKKYFVLIDIRLSEYDSTDIKGLPIFKDDNKAIEFKIPYWALLLEKEDSDGVLFFDEISLAPPLVQSSVYKIVYDRCVNESRISKNWLILGASNLDEDRAYTHTLASPLKDRAGEVELQKAKPKDFIEYMIERKIDSRIIGYLNFKSVNMWKVDFDDNQKYTTNRGWCERVNPLIKDIKEDLSRLRLIVSSAIGEGVASEFVAFCKIKDKVKIEQIIKKPEKLKDFNKPEDLGIKYFIVTALADWYREDKAKFKDIMNIAEVIDTIQNGAEFNALLLRLCLTYKPEFEQEFVKGDTIKFSNKYLKYLKP